MTRRLVCVGAGLSGLVSAYTARKAALARGADLHVTVLDASARAGGNLVTDRYEGFLIDGGPDSWVAAKPEGAALCKELGLGDQLIETIPANRRVYVAHRGRLARMPEGVVLGVPTKLAPVLRSPMLSWGAKVRVLADLVMPRMHEVSGDVSLGELVEMAKRDRSIVRAARAALPKRHGGNAPPSAFVALRDGVGSLVDALVRALPEGAVRLNTPAASVRRGSMSPWEVVLASGAVLLADDVVLGLPTHVAGRLVEGAAKPLADALGAVPYTSAATVFFAYRRGDVPHALDATGFVVPKREGLRLLAGTWVSSKWPGRAPDGYALMRGFLGGAGREDALARDDRELVSEARVDLERLMHFRAEPLFTRVYRFTQTSPLPSVGHAARVAAIRTLLAREPGLHAIGSAYDGVGRIHTNTEVTFDAAGNPTVKGIAFNDARFKSDKTLIFDTQLVANRMAVNVANGAARFDQPLLIGQGALPASFGDSVSLKRLAEAAAAAGINLPLPQFNGAPTFGPNAFFAARTGLSFNGGITFNDPDVPYVTFLTDANLDLGPGVFSINPLKQDFLAQFTSYTPGKTVHIENTLPSKLDGLGPYFVNDLHFKKLPGTTLLFGGALGPQGGTAAPGTGPIVIGANGALNVGGQNAFFVSNGPVTGLGNLASTGFVADGAPPVPPVPPVPPTTTTPGATSGTVAGSIEGGAGDGFADEQVDERDKEKDKDKENVDVAAADEGDTDGVVDQKSNTGQMCE